MSAPARIIECQGLVHIYKTADVEVVALQGLDLSIGRGEVVAIVGASGSGKTTLMNVLAAVDRPSAGRAVVAGWNLLELAEGRRDRYRKEAVGYVWQQAALNFLPELTVEENLQLPMLATDAGGRVRSERSTELMQAFGLDHRRHHLPQALSGGERRLLAVSVSLANKPQVLLADEPTAGLDRAAGENVLSRIREARDREGTTVVFVTHERRAERFVDRVLRIRDGRTSTETSADAGERVIVDRTGRLQLPRHMIDEVGLRALARLRVEGDGILIVPAHDDEDLDG